MTAPTHLYRHFDAEGHLLYVGISKDALRRLAQHQGRDWFTSIANVTIQAFQTRQEAEIAERSAILNEGPVWNVSAGRTQLSSAQCQVTITREQVRTARRVLRWSQEKLASEARIGNSTVRNFEAGRSIPVPNNLTAMETALERAGVEFMPPDNGGAGVRWRAK